MRGSPRAAIIGTGFAGLQHADALRRIGVDVRALVGSSAERAREAAARMGVERSTADARSVLSDPEIDVVHVCVPNALHAPLAADAIAAGKHVVCEKPLATSLADALELAQLARGATGVAVLCHNYRFYAMAAEMRARVARGEIGRVHLVRGAYLQDWLLDPRATSWRIDPGQGGASRAVADIGTHWVDLAETVLGMRVDAVMASVGTVHMRRPDWQHVQSFAKGGDGPLVDVRTEDQAGVLLRFADGSAGTLVVSQVAAGHRNDLTIAVDGADGSIEWRQERPDELRLARLGGMDEHVVRDPAGLSDGVSALARLPAGHGEGWADALRNLMDATYATIAGRRTPEEERAAPLPTFDDGARHIAFVDAVLRSHRDGAWVSVGDIVAEAGRETDGEVHA